MSEENLAKHLNCLWSCWLQASEVQSFGVLTRHHSDFEDRIFYRSLSKYCFWLVKHQSMCPKLFTGRTPSRFVSAFLTRTGPQTTWPLDPSTADESGGSKYQSCDTLPMWPCLGFVWKLWVHCQGHKGSNLLHLSRAITESKMAVKVIFSW